MTALLNWRLWAALALAATVAFGTFTVYRAGKGAGRALVQSQWDKAKLAQQAADVEQGRINAKETQRRLDRQQENQNAQDRQLAAARGDAAVNGAERDKLREQNFAVAQQWSAALGNSPTAGQCEAAGHTIGVLADVLGRADKRAGILAAYADATRIAGLKCEADYDALTQP